MDRNLRFEEVVQRTRLACGAEAIAQGFPESAGYDIFDGILADDLTDWTEQQFLNWTEMIDHKYSSMESGTSTLMKLYASCSEIMADYARLLKSTQEEKNAEV